MHTITAIALAIALLSTACSSNPTRNTVCDDVSATLSGDLATDIVGTFGSFGIDSPVYYDFRADGTWRWVEAPNQYAPDGFQGDGTWSVEGDVITIFTTDGDVSDEFVGIVDADGLTRIYDAGTDDEWSWEHPRVECSGYGF